MKKKRLLSIILATILILSISTTTAITAFATGTDWQKAPKSTAGEYSKARDSFSCTSSSDDTAKGVNTYTYFRSFTELGSGFVSSNNRKMYVKLMEYDPLNADDEVKLYTATFSGRKVNGIELTSLITKGNIEGYKDNVCELYIKYMVSKVKNDPSDPAISSGFFQYIVGID